MKNYINKILKERLNEIIEGGEYILYHGSNHKIERFVDEFVGKEEAYDLEGPGIYFTNDYEDAGKYGKYIYKVKIKPRLLLDTSDNTNVNKDILIKLIKMSNDWESNAQNYDEDPERGVIEAANMAIEYNDNEKDVFLQIWIDFYRYEPQLYVRNMVKLGYDGLVVERENGVIHYIIYNPNIIKIIDILK